MKNLVILLLCLTACSHPSVPVIGMSETEFKEMCKPGLPASTTTVSGTTHVYDLKDNAKYDLHCYGSYTFENGKLTVIKH